MNSFLLVTAIHAFKVLPRRLASSKGEKRLSLAQPDGRDSEGQTWLHWIVHEKWPVYCANLMSSFLLVIEIHAIKVLPRIYLDLE